MSNSRVVRLELPSFYGKARFPQHASIFTDMSMGLTAKQLVVTRPSTPVAA